MDPITGDPKENLITEDPIENPITEDPLRTSQDPAPKRTPHCRSFEASSILFQVFTLFCNPLKICNVKFNLRD